MTGGRSLVDAAAPPPLPPSLGAAAAVPAVQVKRASRQMRHLAQSVVLEESGTSTLVRSAMMIASGTVLLFVLWAHLTPVQETAATVGQVIPAGQVQSVQHLEGGVVAEVLVHDGELVEADQVLVRVSPAQAQSELEQSRTRHAGLTLKVERLRAFIDGREPDFSLAGPDWADMVADQRQQLDNQRKAQSASRDVLLSQLEQKRSDLLLSQSQLTAIGEQIELLREEVAMRGELLEKGLVSKVVYLDNKRELSRLIGERVRLQGQIRTAEEAKSEAESRLLDRNATLTQQANDELGTAAAELAEIGRTLVKLEDRVTRLDVRSPVHGLVQGLKVVNPGAVLQPGALVAQIVPVDQDMQVENHVTPRDIGHVKLGQKVTVKINTFDFSRYGALDGTVVGLSPTTFLDDKGVPYYRGLVSLNQNFVGEDPTRNRVLPGMTVQADIVTGNRTLLEYLLKPIYVSLQQSFHER